MHHLELESVRQAVRQMHHERLTGNESPAINESVLLRSGRVVGHQFVVGRVKIQWLAGESHVWLFQEGQPARAIDLTFPPTAQKAA